MTTVEALREITKDDSEVYSVIGEVVSVDEDLKVCVVRPKDGKSDIPEVRLQAKNDIELGLVVFPVVGSDCIVTFITKSIGYLAVYSEVSKVEIKVSDKIYEFTEGGLYLGSGVSDLKKSIGDLVDEIKGLIGTIKSLQLNHPQGLTTGVVPTSLTILEAHEASLDMIKTGFNTFLK